MLCVCTGLMIMSTCKTKGTRIKACELNIAKWKWWNGCKHITEHQRRNFKHLTPFLSVTQTSIFCTTFVSSLFNSAAFSVFSVTAAAKKSCANKKKTPKNLLIYFPKRHNIWFYDLIHETDTFRSQRNAIKLLKSHSTKNQTNFFVVLFSFVCRNKNKILTICYNRFANRFLFHFSDVNNKVLSLVCS